MEDAVTAILRRELGASPDHIERIEEGLLHETYEVRVASEAYILQFATDTADTDHHENDDALSRGLGCYRLFEDTDIPVPQALTETLQTFDGRGYTLVERLPGTTGERDISPARTRNAGRWLARIHHYREFETPGWLQFDDGDLSVDPFEADTLQARYRTKRAACVQTLRRHGLDEAADEIERCFEGGRLNVSGPIALCHNDFSPDNIRFEGSAVVGILDFDRAVAGHSQRDLVQSATAFWMHDPCVDWDVRETFYEGYRAVASPGDSFEENEPRFRVQTLAQMVAGMLVLDELSDYERGFYSERLLAAVERARA